MTQKDTARNKLALICAISIFALLLTGLPVLAQDATATPVTPDAETDDMQMQAGTPNVEAHAVLRDANGTPIGAVWFIEEPGTGTIAVAVQARGLEPGLAGMSLNQASVCDSANNFESAGDEINIDDSTFPNRAGDLPPLYVISDGTAAMSFRTDYVAMGDLMDGDGTSVLIYETAGNLGADAMGNNDMADTRGAAIACGTVDAGSPPDNIYEGVEIEVGDGGDDVTPDASVEELDEVDATDEAGTEELLPDPTATAS